MRKRLLFPILSISAVALEALPCGAVMNFAAPDGSIRYTYSYFDPLPFGYANFGPLLTAVMTSVLVILSLIYLFAGKKGLKTSITVISVIAFAFSIMPLMFGVAYLSVVGILISAVIAAIFVLSLLKIKTDKLQKHR